MSSFTWINQISNQVSRLASWRQKCDFHGTSNKLGIQIIHIRINWGSPVSEFFAPSAWKTKFQFPFPVMILKGGGHFFSFFPGPVIKSWKGQQNRLNKVELTAYIHGNKVGRQGLQVRLHSQEHRYKRRHRDVSSLWWSWIYSIVSMAQLSFSMYEGTQEWLWRGLPSKDTF